MSVVLPVIFHLCMGVCITGLPWLSYLLGHPPGLSCKTCSIKRFYKESLVRVIPFEPKSFFSPEYTVLCCVFCACVCFLFCFSHLVLSISLPYFSSLSLVLHSSLYQQQVKSVWSDQFSSLLFSYVSSLLFSFLLSTVKMVERKKKKIQEKQKSTHRQPCEVL